MDLSEALSRARVLYAKLCRSVQAYGEEAEYHYENVLGGDVCEHEEDSGYHISYNYEMMQASDEHAIDQQSFALQIKQRVHNLERLAYERESLLEEKKTLRLVYYIHCQVDCHTMTRYITLLSELKDQC